MIRYAESEAVCYVVVWVSHENDWTRVHSPGAFILLRMLSWDSLIAAAGSRTEATDDVNDLRGVVIGRSKGVATITRRGWRGGKVEEGVAIAGRSG